MCLKNQVAENHLFFGVFVSVLFTERTNKMKAVSKVSVKHSMCTPPISCVNCVYVHCMLPVWLISMMHADRPMQTLCKKVTENREEVKFRGRLVYGHCSDPPPPSRKSVPTPLMLCQSRWG